MTAVAKLGAFFVLAGCVAVSGHDYGTEQAPKAATVPTEGALVDSWPVRSAVTFFESTLRGGKPIPRRLQPSDLKWLQSGLDDHLRFVLALHRLYSADVADYVGQSLGRNPRVTVSLDASDQDASPEFGSSWDQPTETLTIQPNVSFLRSIFVSAIAGAEQTGSLVDADEGRPCEGDECIAAFVQFAADLKRSGLANPLLPALAAQRVEYRYSGMLFFTIAHELGHSVLRHHSQNCDAPACSRFRSDELDADSYAAFLLALRLTVTSALEAGSFDQVTGVSSAIGFPLFFERAYPRLIANRSATDTLCPCEYPTEDERAKNANAAGIAAVKTGIDSKNVQAIDGLLRRIELIRAKYPRNGAVERGPAASSVSQRPLHTLIGEEKVGYIDPTGKIAIEPRFDRAGPFSEGLALVTISESGSLKDGSAHIKRDRAFIDPTGAIRFRVNFPDNAAYDHDSWDSSLIGLFHDRLALVERHDKRGRSVYGFIDPTGRMAIDADFDDARDFSEGLAAVRIESPESFLARRAGYIDPMGRFAIEPTYDRALSFSEGLAAVRDGETSRWGYIDKTDTLRIPYRFEAAEEFHEGMAYVWTGQGPAFTDRAGNLAIQGRFSAASDFSEALAAVNIGGKGEVTLRPWVKGGQWGFMQSDGTMIIPAKYAWARPFKEGLAAVNIGGDNSAGQVVGGKWGFVNKQGKLVIAATFDDVGDFGDGIANGERGQRAVVISATGAEVPIHR